MRRLNRRPGLTVGRGCAIHPSAMLDLAEGGSIVLGNNVTLCAGALICPHGGKIELGDNVYVGPYCVIYGHGGLTIGRDTLVAAQTVIIPANHRFDRTDVPIRALPVTRLGVTIGEDCWIASGVKILDGVDVGRGCVIGAGAVVTRSVPEFSIAVGVPARVVGNRERGAPGSVASAAPAAANLESAVHGQP